VTRFFVPSPTLRSIITFDPNFFMVFLLPTIIFESGFSMKKVSFMRLAREEHRTASPTTTVFCAVPSAQQRFFVHWKSILLFALLGTLITAAVRQPPALAPPVSAAATTAVVS
jgi:NhaP-type Na+/H+ or K+/H+ antiporter